jgi:hypothetical protein
MVSNILHRISKKGKAFSLLRQVHFRPLGNDGLAEKGDPRLV